MVNRVELNTLIQLALLDCSTGLYYCGRVWSAWDVGTMNEADFTALNEADHVIADMAYEIVEKIAEHLHLPGSPEARIQELERENEELRAANVLQLDC